MQSDRTQRVLAYLIAMVMVTAVAAAPSVAQETDPSVERVFELTGINADKVDGRHAVKYTTNKVKRAGKLVATNRNGMLPGNIVKPYWGNIQNKPAGFADGKDNVGVAGVKVERVKGPITTLEAGAYGDATVDCPPGAVATGGGPRPDIATFRLAGSTPTRGATGWYVLGQNEGTGSMSLNAWAVCMTFTK